MTRARGIGKGRWCRPGRYTWTDRELAVIEDYIRSGVKWKRAGLKANPVLCHRTDTAIRMKVFELRHGRKERWALYRHRAQCVRNSTHQ